MEGAWCSWDRRDSSKGSVLIAHCSASMTFTNPRATWVHFQNLMELYWPKESLQVTVTTPPAPRTTLCLHTSASSARGILDSAENSLPLASYFIKKLARDQKKKKTMFSYKALHSWFPLHRKNPLGLEILRLPVLLLKFSISFFSSSAQASDPEKRSCPKCPKLHFLVWKLFQKKTKKTNLIFLFFVLTEPLT